MVLRIIDCKERLSALAAKCKTNNLYESGSIMIAEAVREDDLDLCFIIHDEVHLEELGENGNENSIRISKKILVALLKVCKKTNTSPIICHTHIKHANPFSVSFSDQDCQFMNTLTHYACEIQFNSPITFWVTDGDTVMVHVSFCNMTFEGQGEENGTNHREFYCCSI